MWRDLCIVGGFASRGWKELYVAAWFFQGVDLYKKVYLPTCAAQDSGIEYGRQEIKQELDTDDVYQSL